MMSVLDESLCMQYFCITKINYKNLSQRISCNTRIWNNVVHRYSNSNNNDDNNKKYPSGIVVASGRS